MRGPRTKRQFAGAASDPSQRSITSFFKTTSSTSACDAAALKPSKPAALNGPALPPQVQTDLLTVGMRVRKAVPEGYKTGSTYSGFALWSEENHHHHRGHHKNTATTAANSNDWRATAPVPAARTCSSVRELEPFCGINKIGGLAFQPAHPPSDAHGGRYNNSDDDDDLPLDMLDAVPGLTSSQDTVASAASLASLPQGTAATGTTTRKRGFDTEEEDPEGSAAAASFLAPLPYRGPVRRAGDSPESWLVDEISPCSLGPPAGLWENARVLAVPRRPKSSMPKAAFAPSSVGSLAAGQEENVMVAPARGIDGNDFEEASFLDYGLVGGESRMEMD
ncbi:hypothetical protein VTJ83DRAFT_3916 [Remersonia thermophila]|uniref:Uncharacterized protein n=1 Tax=Remersonia thermophila TaxID=72144 RepID=A0ABR4DFY9_9PEZI